jgi:hypothetical protein
MSADHTGTVEEAAADSAGNLNWISAPPCLLDDADRLPP